MSGRKRDKITAVKRNTSNESLQSSFVSQTSLNLFFNRTASVESTSSAPKCDKVTNEPAFVVRKVKVDSNETNANKNTKSFVKVINIQKSIIIAFLDHNS